MSETFPLHCPRCGAPMNRHARKTIEARNAEEQARTDRDLDGVVIEVHCCPACGKVEARPAS